MNDTAAHSLDVLSERGARLRSDHRFDWPDWAQQTVYRLRIDRALVEGPVFVALVGGASSGKSTVFNNLLGGHLTSRIAARGHTTLGPILAIHERHRHRLEPLAQDRKLLPDQEPVVIELDHNISGRPRSLALLFHSIDPLADVALFDLPDFTSQSAYLDGDVAMSLLPWFDRLIVLVDHERWFDRQSISQLRAESVRFEQQRWVLFNRTKEGMLSERDREILGQQAQRMAVDGFEILEFRRGRGFCQFPPGMLDGLRPFLCGPRPDRRSALTGQLAEVANRVLNQNDERTARLAALRESLQVTIRRTVPSTAECMASLMTRQERQSIEPISRILRLHDTRDWLTAQTRRLQQALGQVPLVGALFRGDGRTDVVDLPESADRAAIARAYFESVARRIALELQQRVQSSAFWEEIRRWDGGTPAAVTLDWSSADRDRVTEAGKDFGQALTRWLEKVEAECQGISPSLLGAIGVGTVGLALVLIAAPGPVAALTLVSAKGAVAGALTQLATATGAGALLGKPMGRMISVIQERLMGSDELNAVRESAGAFRGLLESQAHDRMEAALAEAARFVLGPQNPLHTALVRLREQSEACT